MSQAYEDYVHLFCIRCEDVGLDCHCVIYGVDEVTVIDSAILHMFEYHAIKADEITTCMKLKIIENVQLHHSIINESASIL
jgi:predicted small metal-binding protein